MLTQERLKEMLHYDPETGVFTRVGRTSGAKVGDVAGSTSTTGYRYISVDHQQYRAHRLAWLYVYGEFPSDDLDHKDRDRTNNRIKNLRPATNKQNSENRRLQSNNTSGFRGVYWHTQALKWQARICHCGKNMHLGFFDTPEAASEAVEAMRDILFTHHEKKAA